MRRKKTRALWKKVIEENMKETSSESESESAEQSETDPIPATPDSKSKHKKAKFSKRFIPNKETSSVSELEPAEQSEPDLIPATPDSKRLEKGKTSKSMPNKKSKHKKMKSSKRLTSNKETSSESEKESSEQSEEDLILATPDLVKGPVKKKITKSGRILKRKRKKGTSFSRKESETLSPCVFKKGSTSYVSSMEELEQRMMRTRKAESAAEGFEHDVRQKANNEIETSKKKKKKRKKFTSKMIRNLQKSSGDIKDERKKKKAAKKCCELLVEYLNDNEAVEELYDENKKRYYVYKCPEENCGEFIREKLARHLLDKHDIPLVDGSLEQTRRRVIFLWCRSPKHNVPLPAPCLQCNKWHLRIDHHLKKCKYNKHLSKSEKTELSQELKSKYWTKEAKTVSQQQKTPVEPTSPTLVDDIVDEDISSFHYRSKPSVLQPTEKSIDYVPADALKLEDKHFKKYKIREDEYFKIYYPDAEKLLDAFYRSRFSANDTHENALQHRNKVELIWKVLDKDMKQFPSNALSNLHLFRDFYHRPAFQTVGKKSGVQAGTLRSRYTSLSFFISFLRKEQIFSGMSRSQLSSLDEAVGDFNKELNHSIKQQSVDVRQQKLKTLMKTEHFLRYGQSGFIQTLLKPYQEYEASGSLTKKFLTKQYAIRFGDYLICVIAIGNGLRASNVIELTVKDFEKAQVSEDYEGHKIIVNATYKTSTIYGEKFIVLPDHLYNQHMFFLKYLREKVLDGKKSKYFFVPSSKESVKCNQTNVTSKMTSSFQLAGVFGKNEYKRVCCTRIRCAVATFACNEGGFEAGYFAKHFMKNREETTSKHYNLLSNRRHALNIAMHLYESFNIDGTAVTVTPKEVEDIADIFRNQRPTKEGVLKWIEKHNDLSKKEKADMDDILQELEQQQLSKSKRFYGNQERDDGEKDGDGGDGNDDEKDGDDGEKDDGEKELPLNVDFGVENYNSKEQVMGVIEKETEESSDLATASEVRPLDSSPKKRNKTKKPIKQLCNDNQHEITDMGIPREYPKRRRKQNTADPIDIARLECENDDSGDLFTKRFIDDEIGYGVFAINDIENKSYLLTYKGDLVTYEIGTELERRYEEAGAGCYLYFFKHGKQKLCVDATETESLCKYVNDSTSVNSNCRMDIVVRDNKPFLCLFATKNIDAGQELRYNYGEANSKLWWRSNEKYGQPFKLSDLELEGFEKEFESQQKKEGSSDDEWLPDQTVSKKIRNSSDENCASDEVTPSKISRKRKSKFSVSDLYAIQTRFKDFPRGRVLSEENIREAFDGTNVLSKYSWKKIRSRLMYERSKSKNGQ